ncbi:transmembrane protein 183A isoform X1 [Chiroxiphia lanceolata]|uniref:transmembrane protein 183A isoform X1 n=2 Tax=Chiroxiphia lanceolata TaxID=296741 RepID=UPI0013CEFBD5|nr:transmembrane protein 183A isoform X1 [Chiroxiphia lanceolata]
MAPRGRPAAAAAMPRRAARKRLKFRADDVCSERVTVADYANSDPAVVKSGRVKKAVANAVQQEVKSLCGLEASCVPAEEVLSVSGESCDSSDEMDTKESINGRAASRKKKSKRHKESADGGGGEEYPIDIWLLLASYIRPEDIVRFSLICKKAWTVTCTAAFWTRLYRRHYSLDAYLPLRLRPESMEKLHCLRACVIRSLYHMYEPFASRVSRNPAIPDSTPSTLKNSRSAYFLCNRHQESSGVTLVARSRVMLPSLSAFLVQKDCREQTRSNVGIQLQVQKAVPQIEEQVLQRSPAPHPVRGGAHEPGSGLLPAADHHLQLHLRANRHGHDVYLVHHQREHRHAAPPRAPRVPGHPRPQREEAPPGAGGAGGAGPRAQRQAPGLVAPTVPLLPKSLVLSRGCRNRQVTGSGRPKRISRNQENPIFIS